ncbi:hypothetical protein [Falsiroseomonas sp. HW251]|uniref:hypothetical protein n=1 Tax=Falsiroseomonas sp. HW251 TaxID=3390998 RepID=UPI003D3146D4
MRMVRLVVLLGLLAAPAAAQSTSELVRVAEPAGLGRLVRSDGPPDAPLVVMLPDALGDDGRSEPYVDSLLARGIASLVLGLDEDLEGAPSPSDPAASAEALAGAVAWALGRGIPASRIGVMGFGLGGRVALAAGGWLPAAALYPRCAGLKVAAGHAVILQGKEDAAGCADLALPAATEFQAIAAGHGWDVPGAIWPSPGPVLPDPAGGPRLQAREDLTATLQAAEFLAEWFETALGGHIHRAGR